LKSSPHTLVDYGGDKGQYIPDLNQEKSYVLDVSNNKYLKTLYVEKNTQLEKNKDQQNLKPLPIIKGDLIVTPTK
jgi:hypothetical protein